MILWIARILVGLVLAVNADCAISFLCAPGSFAPGFELHGPVGEAVIRGFGVLFLMWNVPYAFAMWHPQKNITSLIQALIMQAVGVFGETMIFTTLPIVHSAMRGSILRFIVFDGAGLVILIIAWVVVLLENKRNNLR
jgi:hypothetical protein